MATKGNKKRSNDGVRDVVSGMADVDEKRQAYLRAVHENRRSLDERAFYPAHDKRKESADYAKIHKQMVDKEDLPCIVCGVRKSTLDDKKANVYGARQLETHHHTIEWALANAIDAKKFNTRIVAHLAARNPDKYGKKDARGNVVRDPKTKAVTPRAFTADEVKAWIDHDRDNLWVLCDVHHRHKWLGIHAISGPIWGPQDILDPKFDDFVRKALSGSGSASSGSRGTSKRKTGRGKRATTSNA